MIKLKLKFVISMAFIRYDCRLWICARERFHHAFLRICFDNTNISSLYQDWKQLYLCIFPLPRLETVVSIYRPSTKTGNSCIYISSLYQDWKQLYLYVVPLPRLETVVSIYRPYIETGNSCIYISSLYQDWKQLYLYIVPLPRLETVVSIYRPSIKTGNSCIYISSLYQDWKQLYLYIVPLPRLKTVVSIYRPSTKTGLIITFDLTVTRFRAQIRSINDRWRQMTMESVPPVPCSTFAS